MRWLLLVVAFGSSIAAAKTTRGYIKKSTGTYVAPYQRSAPNKTQWDNYSAKGNANPFTGAKGTKTPKR